MKDEKNLTRSILVGQNGRITIPAKLREEWGIETGDVLSVIPAGNTLVLSPRTLRTPALIDQMVDMMEGAGVTLEELLEGLPTIRQTVCDAKYSG